MSEPKKQQEGARDGDDASRPPLRSPDAVKFIGKHAQVVLAALALCLGTCEFRAARITFETSKRPWMLLRDIEVGSLDADQFAVRVFWRNFGESPALNVAWLYRFSVADGSMPPLEPLDCGSDCSRSTIAPGYPHGSWDPAPRLTEAEWLASRNAAAHLFLWGEIRYESEFGRRFCYAFRPHREMGDFQPCGWEREE